jgi:hypothetical protein
MRRPGSYAPVVPRPQTTRGRWLARQRADDAAGRFSERVLIFDFAPIAAGDSAQLVQTITSQGGRFMRCVAMRGTTSSDADPTGIDLALLAMRVQLNGDNDLVSNENGNVATLATFFDDESTPWFWFLSPPLLRAGDRFTITITNLGSGEGAPALTPSIGFRMIDDELWQELYTRDWQRERSA